MTKFIVTAMALLSAACPAGAFASALRSATRLRAGGARAMATAISMDSDTHFDYLVIGGGSGGIASARRAAMYGAKVGVVERQALGGTCVNVGCVPKKVMFNAAMVNEMISAAKEYGFDNCDNGPKFNWATIKDMRDFYVKRLNGIYSRNLENSGVTLIEGLASFDGSNSVKVGDTTYTADHINIAVGGKTVMPAIPGIEHCIDSDGFFLLEEQPKKVAVIGAGYIAVELAGIFQELGSATSLFVRGDKALRRFDPILSENLDTAMKKAGMAVVPGSTPKAVTKADDGTLSLELENGDVHSGFDSIMMAVGREPLIAPLALDVAGIDTKPSGQIIVNEYQETSVKGVYALGDVCGDVELTPMAIAAGRRLADRLFSGDEKHAHAKADYTNVPTVVFSHPVIGTMGLTEQEAREKWPEDEIFVYTSTFVNLFYGPWKMEPSEKPKTAYKLICHGADEQVVGMHLIGMGSDEVLQGFGVAMKMGATKADFDACVAIHPTAGEEFVTLAPWGLPGRSPPKQVMNLAAGDA